MRSGSNDSHALTLPRVWSLANSGKKKKKDWSLASSKKKKLTHLYSHSHREVHTSRHDGEKA